MPIIINIELRDMYEKVNPSHPDKIADRIAGAIVDLGYEKENWPKIACEVLIGHGECNIIIETDVDFKEDEILGIVKRISKEDDIKLNLKIVPQDKHLADNQRDAVRCGDNGIFKGVPFNDGERELIDFAKRIYGQFPSDGKYIIDVDGSERKYIVCQSGDFAEDDAVNNIEDYFARDIIVVNPLGQWTGGLDADSGATNRKLGSDMGRAVTGGGLHGKDLSKADVSLNVLCAYLAYKFKEEVTAVCAIGDEEVTFKLHKNKGELRWSYLEILCRAHDIIWEIGGFEKLAEWGLPYEF